MEWPTPPTATPVIIENVSNVHIKISCSHGELTGRMLYEAQRFGTATHQGLVVLLFPVQNYVFSEVLDYLTQIAPLAVQAHNESMERGKAQLEHNRRQLEADMKRWETETQTAAELDSEQDLDEVLGPITNQDRINYVTNAAGKLGLEAKPKSWWKRFFGI